MGEWSHDFILGLGLEMSFTSIWVKCESERSGAGCERLRHYGVAYCWALWKRSESFHRQWRKALQLHTHRQEERGLRRRIMLRRFFFLLFHCRISWGKTENIPLWPTSIWLVCRSQRWVEKERYCAQTTRIVVCAEEKQNAHDFFFTKILSWPWYCLKNPGQHKLTPIPPVSGSHDAVGIPDGLHGILLHLWPPNVT